MRLFDLTCKALDRDFGLAGAPLAVAALNPHAGEGGMFGRKKRRSSPRGQRGPGRGPAGGRPLPGGHPVLAPPPGRVRRGGLHVPRPGFDSPETPALHGRGERHPGPAHHPHLRRPRHRLRPGGHRPAVPDSLKAAIKMAAAMATPGALAEDEANRRTGPGLCWACCSPSPKLTLKFCQTKNIGRESWTHRSSSPGLIA